LPSKLKVGVRLLFDEADLVELWCRETLPETGDEFARGITPLASTYEDAIRVGVADGRIDCADPRTTALLPVYAVEGTATHVILNGSGPTPDEIIAAAQTMTRSTRHHFVILQVACLRRAVLTR
jgi:hypothetical protein